MVGSTPPLPLSASANAAQLPKAYVIAEVEVRDTAAYEDYKSAVVPIVAQYGGRYIARGGQIESVEGSDPSGRMVIIEFPHFAAAQAFLRSEESFWPWAKAALTLRSSKPCVRGVNRSQHLLSVLQKEPLP